MKIFLLSFFIIIINIFSSFSQNKQIDSLKNELSKFGNDTNKVSLLIKIGLDLEKMFNYNKAIEYFIQSANISQSIGFRKGLADNYKHIGRQYLSRSDFPMAMEYYLRSLKISEELGYKINIAGVNMNIGLIYSHQSIYNKALEYFLKGLKIFEELKNKNYIASSYTNIGNVYFRLSRYNEAVEHYIKALKINEELGKSNISGVAANAGNIGEVYFEQKNYEKALEFILKSQKINESIGFKRQLASNLNNIGNIYRELNKSDNALIYYDRAIKLNLEIGDKHKLAVNYKNIGNLYQKQYNDIKAMEFYQKAFKIDEELNDKNEMADKLLILGEIAYHKDRNNTPLKYWMKSLDIAMETGNKNLMIKLYQNIYDYYNHAGNYQKALQFKNLYFNIKDSVFGPEELNKISNQVLNYEIEKRENKYKLLETDGKLKQTELNLQTSYRNYLIIISILVILIAAGLLYLFLNKKKQNKILDQKNNLLHEANLEIDKSYKEKIQLQQDAYNKETQIVKLQNEILETELEQKRKEMTALAINLIDKNEYLMRLYEDAQLIGKAKPEEVGPLVRMVMRSINLNMRTEESWQVFETQFKAIHRGFMEFVAAQYPELTVMEMKVCALLKINLSSKEISSILNLSLRTIEDHRLNIRKKIGLDKDVNLNTYIAGLSYSKYGIL